MTDSESNANTSTDTVEQGNPASVQNVSSVNTRSLMQSVTRALAVIPHSKAALSGVASFVAVVAIMGGLAAAGIINVRSFSTFGGAVARVNGVAIDRTVLDREVKGLATRYGLKEGSDTYKQAEADIRSAALDNLITTELLVQEAGTRGIVVNPDEVASEKSQMVAMIGGEEELNTQLAAVGLTTEALDEYINKDLLIRKLLETAVPTSTVSISDDAVRALYKQTYENAEDAPTFKDAEAQLRAQLENQELEARYKTFVDSLKEKATIER